MVKKPEIKCWKENSSSFQKEDRLTSFFKKLKDLLVISYIKSFIQGVYKLTLWMDCLKSINHWSTAFRNCNLCFQLLTQVPMIGLSFLLLYIKCFTMNEYTLRSETIFDNWKPFKNDKNAVYSILKALFILKILSFCLHFSIMLKNGLIRKTRVILKFMASQPGWQIFTICQYINKIWLVNRI